jgi:S-adenosylmethionine:tRNA ribosyltransferase-isomerase
LSTAVAFELPPRLEAREPPEEHGLARDDVRMLVATRHDGRLSHAHFRDLPDFLDAGDLVVVNTSATLPAAIAATRPDGTPLRLHFSTEAPGAPGERWWVVELRSPDGSTPLRAAVCAGERLTLESGASVELCAPYAAGTRLWVAHVDADEPVREHLIHHGQPIRYSYVPDRWPLSAYQTAYAVTPGSAEMPSAGRPFTPELITQLVARGVLVAPVTLHTGVSSPERHEAPYPERYEVPATTARLVNAVRGWGGRVIAVGTTVVRALETAAAPDGSVGASGGWTNLVVTPERGLRAVDGMVTGWHEPEASHLQMLVAAAGRELLDRSYREALEHGYLWHEFGESHLILP